MGNLVYSKRKLDSFVLEEIKQQAKQSWLSSQRMPTEVVDALVAEVEQLCRELHDERVRRDEWEKMYNQAIAGTEVERLQAKLAEAEFTMHTHEHALNERDKVLATEHQLRRETEQCYRAALTMARHRGDRLEKAEPLATLVTLELVWLLGKIASATKGWTSIGLFTSQDGKAARALAAKIGEALEETE